MRSTHLPVTDVSSGLFLAATQVSTEPGSAVADASDVKGVKASLRFTLVATLLFVVLTYSVASGQAGASSSWVTVETPHAKGSDGDLLRAVSCPDSRWCVAVGWDQTVPATWYRTLIEVWNGRRWSVVPSPNISRVQNDQLTGVSCSSTSSCMAVGYVGSSLPKNGVATNEPTGYLGKWETLTEIWDGRTWSVVPSPNPVTSSSGLDWLQGVSCTSAHMCVAVGWTETNGSRADKSLVERWDGRSWSVMSSPNVTAQNMLQRILGDRTVQPSGLNGVSCSSVVSCVAVGGYVSKLGGPLIEGWNGKNWAIVAGPRSDHSDIDSLNSIWCSNAKSCLAVGEDSMKLQDRPFAESSNGTKWSVSPTPKFEDKDGSLPLSNSLTSVSCSSDTECLAVGIDNTYHKLIELWNGNRWTEPERVTFNDPTDDLAAVSCTSGVCTAVGNSGPQHAGPLVISGRIWRS
jgi:hypothetical protein